MRSQGPTHKAALANDSVGELLLQRIPLGISIVDEAGHLLFVNPMMKEMLGSARLGATCWSTYREDRQPCAECPVRRPIEVGVTKVFDTDGVQGGRTFRISHTGILLQGQKVMLEVFHDITQIAQAQRTIHEMETANVLEAERSRIARDMHDEIGATLTHMKLLGEVLELDADQPEKVSSHARLIAEKAHQMAVEMDEIVWATNPSKDHLENLASYLTSYAEQFLGPTHLIFRLNIPVALPDIPLPSPVRHRLYLAVKEALNNAVKHASANEVRLSLVVDESALRIQVLDDGCGFTCDSAAGERNGLKNMAAGLAEIGGACEIESSPGNGTQVRLTVPLVAAGGLGGGRRAAPAGETTHTFG